MPLILTGPYCYSTAWWSIWVEWHKLQCLFFLSKRKPTVWVALCLLAWAKLWQILQGLSSVAFNYLISSARLGTLSEKKKSHWVNLNPRDYKERGRRVFAGCILCKELWPLETLEKHKSWCRRQTRALARLVPVWRMLALVMSDPFCDISTNKDLDMLAFFETVEDIILCFQVCVPIHWASQKRKAIMQWEYLVLSNLWDLRSAGHCSHCFSCIRRNHIAPIPGVYTEQHFVLAIQPKVWPSWC
jgi:hypothetical protein